MPKLVVLSAGMAGRSHELTVEKTTIGRVEDNTFQIAEPSVSSHHCEISLQGEEVHVKDLGSTNGTFIGGEKISESVLKPGQTLRLGQIELRLDNGAGAPAAPAPAGAAPAQEKKTEQSGNRTRGVSLDELERGPQTGGFDTTSKAFSKKTNQTNKLFIIAGVIIGVVIILVFVGTLLSIRSPH